MRTTESDSRDIEGAYFAVSRFFDSWVRIMEFPTRKMEVDDTLGLADPKTVIISPRTNRSRFFSRCGRKRLNSSPS